MAEAAGERAEGLVQVRTPTYRRPAQLARALRSLQAQTWPYWVCDVYDDDPDGAGRAVCEGLGDPRVRYRHNVPQRFASENIDACFSADNPAGADFFCMVEDDNFLRPAFLEDNMRLMRGAGVELLLRNQVIEHRSGTPEARVGGEGILDGLFAEGVYQPAETRLALIMGIGVSNGGLFWSRRATSRLQIAPYRTTATLQEYMRTFSIREPMYVAMAPLAVWAQNAEQTTRNAGLGMSWLRRELDLKRATQAMQRAAWAEAGPDRRAAFLHDPRWAAGARQRARGLAKALPGAPGLPLPMRERFELAARGLLIRLAGRLPPDFDAFLRSRLDGEPGGAAAAALSGAPAGTA